MRRILSSSAVVLAALIAVAPANAQRRTSLGIAAGATIPTGVLGDAPRTTVAA